MEGPFTPVQRSPLPVFNSQGLVKIIRKIADSPTNPDAEESDELDGEDIEVIPKSSHSQYPKKFSSYPVHYYSSFTKSIHFQTFPGCTTEEISYSPAQKINNGNIPSTKACGQLQRKKRGSIAFTAPCCSSISKKRVLACPGNQRRSQDAVARLLIRVDRNITEVIAYDNHRMIPGTASEEMAAISKL
ncbi:hypothetical protein O181_028459 [Austropuccinia psidii MF-1]|uniref:Uncharacterized protein n=1 Tax=Austropuccinia psidii MF-1 TaxID=1389203 RepID=A0A9Q3CNY3_9BASI|nr:hypothetical protein [Austropuccinia psidii MF-1]